MMANLTQIRAPGTLYIVATPIGNLTDITYRAVEILSKVSLIAAEDTRQTARLLSAYGITTPQMAVHSHNERGAVAKIVERLGNGESVAYVSDAGTPLISDPGALLVEAVRASGYKVSPIPGPSAAICALSADGVHGAPFVFFGFLPATSSARRHALSKLQDLPMTLIFYEAPHRVLETVRDLEQVLGSTRRLTIARELTKVFESIVTLTLEEAADWLSADSNRQRGEFVLLVEGNADPEAALLERGRKTVETLIPHMRLKQAVALAVELTGAKKNDLYQWALSLKPADESL